MLCRPYDLLYFPFPFSKSTSPAILSEFTINALIKTSLSISICSQSWVNVGVYRGFKVICARRQSNAVDFANPRSFSCSQPWLPRRACRPPHFLPLRRPPDPAMGLWKAATRRLGGAAVAGRWRRDIVAVALAVSAAAVILSFSAPYPVSVWFVPPSAVSSSHRTVTSSSSSYSADAGGDSSFERSLLLPLSPPPVTPPSVSSFRRYQEPAASASIPPPSPPIAPLSSLDENSDDEEVEDGGADLKMPPLWRAVRNLCSEFRFFFKLGGKISYF